MTGCQCDYDCSRMAIALAAAVPVLMAVVTTVAFDCCDGQGCDILVLMGLTMQGLCVYSEVSWLRRAAEAILEILWCTV